VTALTAGLLAAGTLAGRPDDPDYYRALRQAPYASPPAAFGPAWTIAKLGWSVSVLRAARTVPSRDRNRLARNDKAAAAALLPQAAWLTLATPVAVYQAQANPDPIFGDRLVSR
jgi:tryptophan-rich sensory protein